MAEYTSNILTAADAIRILTNGPKYKDVLNIPLRGHWHSYSTQECLDEIKYLTLGLYASEVKKGDAIGIMASGSPRWLLVNFAIQIAGGVVVPLFPNMSEENFVFEVKETGLKSLFINHQDPVPIFERHKDLFKIIIELSESGASLGDIDLKAIEEKGKEVDRKEPDKYEQLLNTLKPDDLAAIIFTSATTGSPKGVMLTHKNMYCHMDNVPIEFTNRRYLSILPLAHIFGYNLASVHFIKGGKVYFIHEIKHLLDVCREVKPMQTAVVPRVLEKIYNGFKEGIKLKGGLTKKIGLYALHLASKEHKTCWDQFMMKVMDPLVYKKLRDALGGHFKLMFSGGARLDPDLNRFFNASGITVLEGWGLTEACPITFNRLEKNKIGTVGTVFDGWEIKISPSGEVLVGGPGVMRGYYKQPDLTHETIDAEGWLHTGDRGEIDEEGYLTLKGRIKELFKTSTGEYISPTAIEDMLVKIPIVDAAMVVAEGRKFASTLLFADLSEVAKMKKQYRLEHLSDEEFLRSSPVKSAMHQALEEINQHLNHWERVHAYTFVAHSPSIEKGEMTPSLKLRRTDLMERYKTQIDAMYT